MSVDNTGFYFFFDPSKAQSELGGVKNSQKRDTKLPQKAQSELGGSKDIGSYVPRAYDFYRKDHLHSQTLEPPGFRDRYGVAPSNGLTQTNGFKPSMYSSDPHISKTQESNHKLSKSQGSKDKSHKSQQHKNSKQDSKTNNKSKKNGFFHRKEKSVPQDVVVLNGDGVYYTDSRTPHKMSAVKGRPLPEIIPETVPETLPVYNPKEVR